MKGTQSSCRLSGCTDLCTLYERYTECMQTLSWNTRIHADPLGWYTDGIMQSELTFFTQVALKCAAAVARACVQVESPTVVANLAVANCKQINRFYFPVAIRRYIFSLNTKR